MAGLLALLDQMGQPEWLDHDESERTVLSDAHEIIFDGEGNFDPAVLNFPSMVAATLRKLVPPQAVGGEG
jgi:hypothetical protein